MRKLIALFLALLLISPGSSFAAFRKSKPWGIQKPSLGTQIDWGNPITTGLRMASIINAGGTNAVQDLVTQKIFTVAGAPTINTISPKWGQGLRFPGTNDLLSETAIPASTANNPITLFVIARVEDTTVGNRKRAIRFWDTTNGTVANIEFSDGGTINDITGGIQYAGGLFEQANIGGFSYVANADYPIALTWKPGDNVRMYINGTPGDVSSSTRNTILSGNNLSLGGNTSGGGLNLRGTLFVAYVWYRCLSRTEIESISFSPYQFFISPRMFFVQPAAGGPTAITTAYPFLGGYYTNPSGTGAGSSTWAG